MNGYRRNFSHLEDTVVTESRGWIYLGASDGGEMEHACMRAWVDRFDGVWGFGGGVHE